MRVTIPKLQERARGGEKLVMLTCYDASFAAISDAAGVDILLIGDSLGMVIQGHDSTLPVTMEETEYHVRASSAGAPTPSSSPTCPSAASRSRRSRPSATPRASWPPAPRW